MGAWIETGSITYLDDPFNVAPRMGAWIETIEFQRFKQSSVVAPRMGAWIETISVIIIPPCLKRRAPHGRVD